MEPLILSDSKIVRDILRRIKNSKGGCRLDDFKRWFPDYLTPIEHGGPEAHPPNDLRQLLSWGLVDAYDGAKKVGLDEIKDEITDPGNFDPLNIERLTFRLSDFARHLEKHLEISLTARPTFGPAYYDNANPWADVFMLMPFNPELIEVQAVAERVKAVAGELELTSGRADNSNPSANESIIKDIWSGIDHAKVIVADCTGQNPNVLYEIGIAHTRGKETIIICREGDKFPFDVNYLRIIFYRNTPEGMREFEAILKTRIEESLATQGFRQNKT